jgi:ABC-type dipeptide/oligopeptide/nickel transport system permease subunit
MDVLVAAPPRRRPLAFDLRAPRLVRRLSRHKGALVSSIVLLTLVLLAVFAPLIASYDPTAANFQARLQPPSAAHLLGTDALGRDVFSRILYGGRISLSVGLIAVLVAVVLGLGIGLPSGFYRGWVDGFATRLIDSLMAFPGIFLALAIMTALGPGLEHGMIALGIAGAPSYARLIRGSTLSASQHAYIEAARCVGCSDVRIMGLHLVPNVIGPLIVLATVGLGQTIVAAASLSFLGLGAQPPSPEWGAMLGDGRDYIYSAWWASVFAGLAILIATVAINIVGDGLREALDPQQLA